MVAFKSDVEHGFVEIGEQNYNKHGWDNFHYSRRLVLEKKNGKYFLTNKSKGRVYPKVIENSDSEESDEEGIVGWKRIEGIPIKNSHK